MRLHRFGWLEDQDIGELDVRWNWLMGEYDHPPADVKNAHWSVGGPYFEEYVDAAFADEWFKERDLMPHSVLLAAQESLGKDELRCATYSSFKDEAARLINGLSK